MSFESSALDLDDRQVNRQAAADAGFSLFSASQPDGIWGTRPSSPFQPDNFRSSSPFQTVENRPTSPFQTNAQATSPFSSGDILRTSVLKPQLQPHPNPWSRPASDSSTSPVPLPRPEPQAPLPRPGQDRPQPQPPRPAPSVPRPAEEPWDKAPGGPWGRGGSGSGSSGPFDRNNGSDRSSGDSGGPWGRGDSSPNSGSGRAKEATQAFDRDQVSRTSYSFKEAVAKEKALGKENEVALESQMRDWLSKQNTMSPIAHMRGTAVLASALGEFRLEEGSRIDLTSHANTKARILKGYDYDFGGEANIWLRMAAGSLVSAQNYVIGHKGLVIDGQPMDDAYLQQLKGLQTDVETQLERIYGPHDVEAVYAEVRNQVRVKSGDWQQGLVRLKRELDEMKSPDPRYVAKRARDVALGFLAEADYMSSKNNGEEAKIMYTEANQYLAMSRRLDGVAPDNYALASISERLKPQINKALDNQWGDPWSNPFEIPKPADSVLV